MDEEKTNSSNVETPPINEVKEEGGKFFSIQTRTKWIVAISIILLILCGVLVYASIYAGLEVEIWQAALWGLCVPLSIYAIVMRSIAAIIFELALFFGVSLIPAWQMGYEYFRPVIEKMTG